MPFKIISCDTCDFKASTTCLWGMFDYVSPDGTYSDVNRTYGWCYSCQNVCPVEDLSDEDKLKDNVETDAQKLAVIQKTGIIGKLLLLLGKNKLIISNLKEKLESNRHRLKFLHERKSPPKCLTCSGTEIEVISIPNPQGKNIDKIEELHHPDCGGHLLVQNSDWWINAALSTKEYDLNGNLIKR